MPTHPRYPCRTPRCPNLVERPGRCPQHQTVYDRRSRAATPWREYSSAEWRRLRAQVKVEQPVCGCTNPRCRHHDGPCTAATQDVHHVVPLREVRAHRRDLVRGICKRCHGVATRWEQLARRNAAKAAG